MIAIVSSLPMLMLICMSPKLKVWRQCLSFCHSKSETLTLLNTFQQWKLATALTFHPRILSGMTFSFLLQNRLANFNQIWHKASLGEGNSSFFK